MEIRIKLAQAKRGHGRILVTYLMNCPCKREFMETSEPH